MKALCAACLAFLSGCASVETSIVINAPAKDVRAVLYDFADYPKWNPFLIRVEGTAEDGKQLYVTVKEAGKPELTGDVTVISATDSLLSWSGTATSQMESGSIDVGLPGVLSARHEFIIEEQGPARTLFSNNDKLSGALVSLYNSKGLQTGLGAMNEALKKRVEQVQK
ncbi:MAG TPA: SRPBCC domain-containing protein [Opitutaceae bacterium]